MIFIKNKIFNSKIADGGLTAIVIIVIILVFIGFLVLGLINIVFLFSIFLMGGGLKKTKIGASARAP